MEINRNDFNVVGNKINKENFLMKYFTHNDDEIYYSRLAKLNGVIAIFGFIVACILAF